MDQGPVDAGPHADNEFDGAPSRSYTPEHERSESQRRPGFRSASSRRSNAREHSRGDAEGLRHVRSGRRRSVTEESLSSLADPPMYTKVGATTEEEKGEVCIDDDTVMKEDPMKPDVKDAESKPHRMFKFTLYETNARYWITGADITEKYFRLLRIDRTSPPGQIALFEDETVYSRKEMNDVLNDLDQGNKATNGLRIRYSFWGLLGFIRFTEAYYMLVITKRRQAAMLGGHYVYQVEGTDLVPLTTGASSAFARDRNAEEARFLNILHNLDLSKSFYFSYSYDITHSLQNNIVRQRQAINEGRYHAAHEYNGMFVWNHHLLKPAVTALKHPYDWCLPIIHGFLDQAALDIFGRTVYVAIIGRRSRFFAGARFLKRGINDLGYVANDVETEQIITEKLTTSFHAPGPRLYANPTYSSYVQHRGSIPLYWTQDHTGVTPKPGIDINLSDPFYEPAALHFDNLFERYGCPVYVLNLIKAREKVPRESKLLREYETCIEYLNNSLPEDKKILYKAYDMARMAKTRNGNVIGGLEVVAKDVLERTGFFHNGRVERGEGQVQNGVARTNCIDCLDRTNAAQFVIGKHAFALQLKKLGVITTDEVAYDTDAVNMFTEMFHNHGDNIAMQYGGSHLVNTMATYRKLNHWQNSSRDMVESFKRYYHNSFLDSQRQEAYNLFLGNYIWAAGQPMLWDLPTDYYLHHSNPQAWLERNRRDYIQWYTPHYLETRVMPPNPSRDICLVRKHGVSEFDDYWRECYRPTALSSLQKVFSYRMNSTQRYMLERPHPESRTDFSPFVRRIDPHNMAEKKPPRKGVTIVDPQETPSEPLSAISENAHPRPITAGEEKPSILRETIYEQPLPTLSNTNTGNVATKPADKAQMHLYALNQIHTQSLNPSVSATEAKEYAKYISHPLNLPLVVSNELPTDANLEYLQYIHKSALVNADAAFDAQDYDDFVKTRVDPLTVTDEDREKRRYKAYRQWLKGKSLFKQNKVDPEFGVGF